MTVSEPNTPGTRARRVTRDVSLRTSAGYRLTCLTMPVVPALWGGLAGVFEGRTVLILVLVGLALGVTMCVIWARAFVNLTPDTLRYRVYGRLREVPVSAVDYPEERRGFRGHRLIVRSGGRRVLTLDARVWGAAGLKDLARELTARRSAAAHG